MKIIIQLETTYIQLQLLQLQNISGKIKIQQ